MSLDRFLKKAKAIEEANVKRKEEKKHAPEAHDESNWLVSYADMMTLLCGFFIMMFSMSSLDQPKFEAIKESVAHQFGGKYESPTKELAKFVSQILQEAGVDKNAVVKSDPLGVSVVFQSAVFFDTLSSEVRNEGSVILSKLIAGIQTKQAELKKKYRIVIEGHTDGRPIVAGIYPSNWELSAARAARVVRMFLGGGFSPKDLVAIGYADTHPEAPDRTPAGIWDEEGLAKNRRVVVRILEPNVDSIPTPQTGNGLVEENRAAGTSVSAPEASAESSAPNAVHAASTPGATSADNRGIASANVHGAPPPTNQGVASATTPATTPTYHSGPQTAAPISQTAVQPTGQHPKTRD